MPGADSLLKLVGEIIHVGPRPTWCLMWLAGPFHVTHKYLGEATDAQVRDAIGVVDEYFQRRRPASTGPWFFNQPDLFGPDSDVHVLRCDPREDMMLDLKEILDYIVPDGYGKWKPHVTCDPCFESIAVRPTDYVMTRNGGAGGKVVRSWGWA